MKPYMSKVVWDMETLAVVEEVYTTYSGPADQCKGGLDQAREDARKRSNEDQQIANQQLAQQQKILGSLSPQLQAIISGGGYSPGVREALTSQAINSVPQQYSQIASALQTRLGERGLAGGQLPGGGGYARDLGNLYSQEEQNKSALLSQIPIQGQQNIFGALSGLGGVAGQYGGNAGNLFGAANNAQTNQVNAANYAAQASNGLIGSIVGGSLGVLGNAVMPGGALAGKK